MAVKKLILLALCAAAAACAPTKPPAFAHTPTSADTAITDPAKQRRRFGAYVDVLDKRWLYTSKGGDTSSWCAYEWLVPGRSMRAWESVCSGTVRFVNEYVAHYNLAERRLGIAARAST